MVLFHTSQHDFIGQEPQLLQCRFALLAWCANLRDWIEDFLIEDRHMLEAVMPTDSALLFLVLRPMQLATVALLTEVTGKRLHFEEAKKREELANAVLNGSSRQTPLVVRFESEAGAGHTSRTLLDVVSFVENQTMKVDRVDDTWVVSIV